MIRLAKKNFYKKNTLIIKTLQHILSLLTDRERDYKKKQSTIKAGF